MSAFLTVAERIRSTAASDGPGAARAVEEYAADPATTTLEVEALRLSVEAGLLDGFLDQARDVVLHHAHPWHEAPVDSADTDPHTQASFGQAFAVGAAVSALVAEVVTAVAAAHPDAEHRVALARGYANRRVGEVVNDVIGVLGASSATNRHGLDRHWRAVRLLGAEHPPSAIPAPGSTEGHSS